jgi:hypothetical protein
VKHVPTAAELVRLGLAEQVTVRTGAKTTAGIFVISAAGYALIREAMAENAAEAVAAGRGTWTRPPSSGKPMAH